jgi:hypothetical protein
MLREMIIKQILQKTLVFEFSNPGYIKNSPDYKAIYHGTECLFTILNSLPIVGEQNIRLQSIDNHS